MFPPQCFWCTTAAFPASVDSRDFLAILLSVYFLNFPLRILNESVILFLSQYRYQGLDRYRLCSSFSISDGHSDVTLFFAIRPRPINKKRDPGRSLGAVYRILNVIMEQCLIQKLPFGSAMLKFAFFQDSIVDSLCVCRYRYRLSFSLSRSNVAIRDKCEV